MPRESTTVQPYQSETFEVGTIGSLTASARELSEARAARGKTTRSSSGSEKVWSYLAPETGVGEFGYACNWVGNNLARAQLVLKRNGTLVTEGPAFEEAQRILGGPKQQAAALQRLGIHFTAVGLSHIVIQEKDGHEEWTVASSAELRNVGGKWELHDEELSNAIIIEMWNPDPHNAKKATAPGLRALRILRILSRLTDREDAIIDSRLTGNGLLLVPNEVSFASARDGAETSSGTASADELIKELMEIASYAIQNPTSPAAKIPLVLQIPGEHVKNVRHLDLYSALDKATEAKVAANLKRLALSMDMPPEVLMGSADMNHWSMWQVDEASVKSHIEPLLTVLTGALTTQVLWRFLEANDGVPDEEVREYTLDADTTELRLRPNRSKEAFELHDRGAINDAALLREVGFDPDQDAMEESEYRRWLMRKVALGQTTPDIVAHMLREIGLDVPEELIEPDDREHEQRPTRSLEEHPTRELPDSAALRDIARLAASEQMVLRALERAGNRIKGKFNLRLEGIPARELYLHAQFDQSDIADLLTDAFTVERSWCIDDPEVLARNLKAYSTLLMLTRQPHTLDELKPFASSSELVLEKAAV